MKIALLTQGFRTFAPEAANITLQILAEELSKKGHEVVIFCNQIWGQPLFERIDGYKVIRQEANYDNRLILGLKFLNFSKMIKEEVKKSKKEFDVIHNFSASPLLGIRAVLAKKYSKNVKLIQTIKSKTIYSFSYLFTFLLNYFDSVTVPNNILKKTLSSFGLENKKIKIVSSYIDTRKFKPMNKQSLKKKYGLAGKKIILYYGHMSETKGVSYLINALESIKNEDFIALFVTGSWERAIKPYEDEIKKKKLQDKIKIMKTPVKRTKNIEEYVAMADIAVFSYPNLISTESQPSCILESMASKTAVITSDLPELREFLNEKEVVFAKPKNVKSLAEKIKSTLKANNIKMINNAYRKSKEFEYKKIIKKYLEIYQK